MVNVLTPKTLAGLLSLMTPILSSLKSVASLTPPFTFKVPSALILGPISP